MAIVAAAHVMEDYRGRMWKQGPMKDHGDMNQSSGDGGARCGQTLADKLYLPLDWEPKPGMLSSKGCVADKTRDTSQTLGHVLSVLMG